MGTVGSAVTAGRKMSQGHRIRSARTPARSAPIGRGSPPAFTSRAQQSTTQSTTARQACANGAGRTASSVAIPSDPARTSTSAARPASTRRRSAAAASRASNTFTTRARSRPTHNELARGNSSANRITNATS
ncbi:MAG: hypothetical protein JWP46_272 [Modestobacter sp.]|nr:hypothetical protein [Modestobacter sp.]MCW2676144.1 hypothetical protein [Modestobacter sp.]